MRLIYLVAAEIYRYRIIHDDQHSSDCLHNESILSRFHCRTFVQHTLAKAIQKMILNILLTQNQKDYLPVQNIEVFLGYKSGNFMQVFLIFFFNPEKVKKNIKTPI